jgi:hypothetical protein
MSGYIFPGTYTLREFIKGLSRESIKNSLFSVSKIEKSVKGGVLE